MYPRGTLDIGWTDLAAGLWATLRPTDAESVQRTVEEFWDANNPALFGGTLACLSVRSGFDALLQALSLPAGDEILVSAITIRDMTRIIEAHGLVPVPVDLDMESLTLSPGVLDRAVSPRSRALLVAHIFGGRMPMAELAAWSRQHGLLLIEDCAQSYAGQDQRGDAESDVTMFSFGPIKTNTALGGAVLEFRDPSLLARVRAVQTTYPRQSPGQFRRRVFKYIGLKALSSPVMFGVFAAVCRATGRSHDAVISAALRGFPGPDLLRQIRRRPSGAMLALLYRRLTSFDAARIQRRVRAAEAAIAMMPQVPRPGSRVQRHTHWTFPIEAPHPDVLMERMWAEGFDATRGASSLAVVPAPDARPEVEPVNARAAMDRLLYLPVSPLVRQRDLKRLAQLATEASCRRPEAHDVSHGSAAKSEDVAQLRTR